MLSNRKMILDRLKNDIKGNITKIKLYEEYENGKTVYYNPVKGEICSDYSEDNSKAGVKDGCLKWYIFNDNGNNDKVTMILDHNTTATVAYNSTGKNTEMKEVKTALENDTKNWKNVARLISAEEIAEITNNKNWNSLKSTEFFYFETNTINPGTTCNNSSNCKYGWLFDRTNKMCTSSGCYNNSDVEIRGYWTSTKNIGKDNYVWNVGYGGSLGNALGGGDVTYTDRYGIRPVIEIEKDLVKKSGLTVYSNGSIIFYDPVKNEICTNYSENNSKTGVKDGCLKWYIFNDNKDNSSANLLLDHNTTGSVVWSSVNNTEMKEVKTALETDTKNWKNDARLITVDDVARITGADKILKFDSKKSYKRPVTDIETQMSWFYFDGKGSTYEEWQTQVANKNTKSKYAWIFDNLKECTNYGCNNEGDNLGYWTSNSINSNNTTSVWYIYSHGMLGGGDSTVGTWNGVRPVTKIDKAKIKLQEPNIVISSSLPSSITKGDKYDIVDKTKSIGYTTCESNIDGKINDTSTLSKGTHTITCSSTTGLDNKVSTTKKITVTYTAYTITNQNEDAIKKSTWYNYTDSSMYSHANADTIMITHNNAQSFLRYDFQTISGVTNHIFYAAVISYVESETLVPGLYIISAPTFASWNTTNETVSNFRNNISINTWTRISLRYKSKYDKLSNVMLSQSNGSGTGRAYYTGLMVIDLTKTFGSGNEPSVEWCDKHINYFEGTTTIYK